MVDGATDPSGLSTPPRRGHIPVRKKGQDAPRERAYDRPFQLGTIGKWDKGKRRQRGGGLAMSVFFLVNSGYNEMNVILPHKYKSTNNKHKSTKNIYNEKINERFHEDGQGRKRHQG